MSEQNLETTTLNEPVELHDDTTSEEYSEFITENPEPIPGGNFFEENTPLVTKVEDATYEEDLEDLPIDVVEQKETAELDQQNSKVVIDSSANDRTSEDIDRRRSSRKSKNTDVSFPLPRATVTTIDGIFRASVRYETLPRMATDNERKVSGDFVESVQVDNQNMWFNLLEYADIIEEEPEEKEKAKEEEPPKKEVIVEEISRPLYYEKHAKLKQELSARTVENNILQRKIAIYFRRKNMDYAWKDSRRPFENKHKYHQRLDEYEQLMKHDTAKRGVNDKHLETLKNAIEKSSKMLRQAFNDLQKREKETGTGLIYTKTGTELSEKLIQQYINRQKTTMEKLTSMRQTYLKLKRMVAEKESTILSINKVDEDHHLNDYEKLKSDNKIFCDKVEEREVELTALRFRCNHTIQVLAHLKEKISAFDSDIMDLRELLTIEDTNVENIRSRLIYSKKERDTYRSMHMKLQEKSGMLTERVLLRDMERCMQEVDVLKTELEDLKTNCNSSTAKIRRIRKVIEGSLEAPTKKAVQRDTKRKINVPVKLNKEQPFPFNPTLPKRVMDHHIFERFQPTVTRININKN